MIVVVDTNVWISGLHFGGVAGVPFRALSRASELDTIATCDEIDAEVARVLEGGFGWKPERVSFVLGGVLERAIRVRIHGTVSLCRDPDDDKFLECAERASADLIVTGDKDLLTVGVHGCTRIVTPAEYLKLD
ncbi:MAG: putative toxin-antitoxin system toxin component, PIN family [Acidobacteriaceae bacterium]